MASCTFWVFAATSASAARFSWSALATAAASVAGPAARAARAASACCCEVAKVPRAAAKLSLAEMRSVWALNTSPVAARDACSCSSVGPNGANPADWYHAATASSVWWSYTPSRGPGSKP